MVFSLPKNPEEESASVTGSTETTPGTKREEQFDRACSAAKKVFVEKNAQYGDAIASTGVLGAVTTLIGDASRLRKMVLKSPDYGKTSKKELIELLKDIHNYADISMMMIMDDNWSGPD